MCLVSCIILDRHATTASPAASCSTVGHRLPLPLLLHTVVLLLQQGRWWPVVIRPREARQVDASDGTPAAVHCGNSLRVHLAGVVPH